MKHQGTNGGEAYKKKCRDFWLSVRFQVELAYLQTGSYAGAARELNRKKVETMNGGDWFPMTVKYALDTYSKIDNGE